MTIRHQFALPSFTRAALGAVLGLSLISAAPRADRGTLTVDVGNIRVAKGKVHVDVCPEDKFLKDDCPWSGDAKTRRDTTRVTVTDLPPGRYAVRAFLDENSNGKVDRALLGIPKEGIGFSNDARIHLGPPKWADAVFDFDGDEQEIHFDLRYLSGPKGPKGY